MGGESLSLAELVELHKPQLFQHFLQEHPQVDSLPLQAQLKIFRNHGINDQTQFFRDEQVLSAFERLVLPSYPGSYVIHVASVGCSTGQEPYSLLLRNWGIRKGLRIDACDVNRGNINTAAAGEYEVWTGTSSGDLKRFQALEIDNLEEAFTLSEGRYKDTRHLRFTEESRGRIRFFVYDILEERLPQTYDVVLLLNVLMHYSEKGREKIIGHLFDSMHEGAWLMCEKSPLWDEERDRMVYRRWMEDISRLGFEKQRVILPEFFIPDQTLFSQIYRKREVLRVHTQ
ncbi:hypothetical protein HYX02_05375 [Candidatus Woesearchaeota archaeon]|nr:hypothetical protein [Candidatus Woesearchaeota archaeon]